MVSAKEKKEIINEYLDKRIKKQVRLFIENGIIWHGYAHIWQFNKEEMYCMKRVLGLIMKWWVNADRPNTYKVHRYELKPELPGMGKVGIKGAISNLAPVFINIRTVYSFGQIRRIYNLTPACITLFTYMVDNGLLFDKDQDYLPYIEAQQNIEQDADIVDEEDLENKQDEKV